MWQFLSGLAQSDRSLLRIQLCHPSRATSPVRRDCLDLSLTQTPHRQRGVKLITAAQRVGLGLLVHDGHRELPLSVSRRLSAGLPSSQQTIQCFLRRGLGYLRSLALRRLMCGRASNRASSRQRQFSSSSKETVTPSPHSWCSLGSPRLNLVSYRSSCPVPPEPFSSGVFP